jgi:tetratricopeptide (TPR) repeat protein
MTAMTKLRRQAIVREAAGYIELGELLVETDKPVPHSAANLLARALRCLGELPEPTRSRADVKLLEGEALRALGRWQEAIAPLTVVSEQDPKRLEAWLGLGWCLKRLSRLGDAIDILKKGLVAAPQQPILHYNLACYLSLDGNVQAAIEHLTRAIAIDGRFRDLTEVEPDFDPIRTDPRFVAVTTVTV